MDVSRGGSTLTSRRAAPTPPAPSGL